MQLLERATSCFRNHTPIIIVNDTIDTRKGLLLAYNAPEYVWPLEEIPDPVAAIGWPTSKGRRGEGGNPWVLCPIIFGIVNHILAHLC